ncbi:type II toxin-antitoxin system HipA family toxin [Agromyces protaetiae]|uniref:type II toxin-antitoxin system HipA family toxin n=1 Tax=Agromyces protaetiae TaxID=2509455 RepID=UPI0013E9B7E7|nr:HipA domain-containing protein [Agromyces protaetiae]
MVDAADVYKSGVLAGSLTRTPAGIAFDYADSYPADAPQVATTLPRTDAPLVTPAGAVPPFFAGLLPEGRRLTALRRAVKTSADDELSLLVAVGADTIGDVQVVAHGEQPPAESSGISIDARAGFRFDDLLAEAGVSERPALAGVQDKASAAMLSLPVRRRGERFILKLDPPDYPNLVDDEAFFLSLAHETHLPAVRASVLTDASDRHGLLVTRFDRVADTSLAVDAVRSIAVEDAAQVAGVWPADKYNLSFEQAASALIGVTKAPAVAGLRLLEQLAFAWLTGNGDQHAKNLSVFEAVPGEFRVAPAYDLPATLFYGDETLALTVGGRDTLTAARFVEAANEIGVPPRAATRALSSALNTLAALPDRIEAGALPFDRRVNVKAARTLRRRHRELGEGLARLREA